MVIAKFSYIGAAGLGIVLALGGVRTLAFPGQAEPKPIGLASAPAQNSAGPLAAPKEATPPDSRPDDRIAAMSSYLSKIEGELRRSNETVAEMREQIRKVRGELDSIARDQRQAAEPASAPVPPTAARKDRGPGDWDRPHYVEVGGNYVVVFSADGRKVAAYDPQTGKSRPIPLPPIRGGRREFLVMAENPYRVATRKAPGEIETAPSPWFFALDLDRDNKLTRIAAFNASDGTYIGEEIHDPVDRSSLKIYGGTVFSIGCRLYALSGPAKRWGMLEWPPGTTAKPTLRPHVYWAEKDGRLYRFNYSNGQWEDIYAHAIGSEPAEAR